MQRSIHIMCINMHLTSCEDLYPIMEHIVVSMMISKEAYLDTDVVTTLALEGLSDTVVVGTSINPCYVSIFHRTSNGCGTSSKER